MIINILLFIISLPIYILGFFSGLLNGLFPDWLTLTINNIVGGSGVLNTVLPMYPHPGMSGLAGTLGIMPLFGWGLILMSYLMILSLVYKLIKIILSMFSIGQGPHIGTGGR